MKLHSVATAILMAGITGSSTLVHASHASEQALPITSSEPGMSSLPVSAEEFLTRLQTAMAQGALLQDSFYSTTGLQQFFGPGYRFTRGPDMDGQKTIYFDDGDNIYVQHGAPTTLGLHRPCLQGGMIMFTGEAGGRKTRASMGIQAMGPAVNPPNLRIWLTSPPPTSINP